VLAGKTGYNDVARYCLVVATRIDGRLYFMSFLSNEGKLTRFGDVARVADWILAHKPKLPKAAPVVAAKPSEKPAAPAAPAEPVDNVPATPTAEAAPGGVNPGSVALPVGVAAPENVPSAGAATTAAP
jgi:D-alanyl-D-alanine carboxypeptidase